MAKSLGAYGDEGETKKHFLYVGPPTKYAGLLFMSLHHSGIVAWGQLV